MYKKSLLIGGGILVIVVILTLVTYFGDQLMTAVVKPEQLTVQASTAKIAAGGEVSLTWGTKNSAGKIQAPSKVLQKAYPSQKIELVVKDKKGVTKIYTLAAKTNNDGKETVTIPTNITKGGTATFRLSTRNAKGTISTAATDSSSVAVSTTAAPVKKVATSESSSGGGGGSGGGGSGGGSGGSSSSSSNPYQLVSLCYEGNDNTIHLGWKPIESVVRYRKVGESEWYYPGQERGFNSNPYDDFEDVRTTIFYTGGNNQHLPPNTDFEFYFLPTVNPPGPSADSQIYRYNSGPLPGYSECRSLL